MHERRQTNELPFLKAARRDRVGVTWAGRILPVSEIGIVRADCLLQFLQSVISDVNRRRRDAEIILGPTFGELARYGAGTLNPASIVKGGSRDSSRLRISFLPSKTELRTMLHEISDVE